MPVRFVFAARLLGPALVFASIAAAVVFAGCAGSGRVAAPGEGPVDARAEGPTRALFANLWGLAGRGVLFGHHDDLAYGVTWRGEAGRSDVKETAGAYPAVYGWDVTRLFGRNPDEASPERAAELRRWILEGYRRGGVATLCWHMPNPVTDTHAWDTTRAVYQLLPGGALHDDYKAKLDVVAAFFKSLKTGGFLGLGGRRVPVIFRPFHEHTGSWFWWGRRHSTVDEFVALWRFTVEYLRDVKGVHNVLYAYSTDVFDTEAEYLERYPGDAYIDLLGFDDYHSLKSPETRDVFVRRVRTVAALAQAHGKLAAVTETGVEAVPDPTWWTGVLLEGLKADPAGRQLAFVLVWRNANGETDRKNHFYAPYPGHPSVPDFVRFKNDPIILFEDELPDLYR